MCNTSKCVIQVNKVGLKPTYPNTRYHETNGNVLWECEKAQDVWTSSGIPIQHHGTRFGLFLDLFWHLMLVQHAGDELVGLTVAIAWSLWHERNIARTGGTWQTRTGIIQRAIFLLEEFRSANHKFQSPIVPHTVTWSPPNSPWYKINTDGAVFKQVQAIGIGVVARDHEGQVIAAMSKKLWVPLGPLKAEAKVMEEGIIFACDVGLQEVTFECDSKLLFQALTSKATPSATISNVAAACLCRLQGFRAPQFSHVRHQRNRLAHILVQYAKNLDSFVTWIEENPTIIENATAQDVFLFQSS